MEGGGAQRSPTTTMTTQDNDDQDYDDTTAIPRTAPCNADSADMVRPLLYNVSVVHFRVVEMQCLASVQVV